MNLLHYENIGAIGYSYKPKSIKNLSRKNLLSRVKNMLFPLETAIFSSSIKPARKIRLRPGYENYF